MEADTSAGVPMSPFAFRAASLAVALHLCAPISTAGVGQLENGRFDPLVYFAYPESDPSAWEPVFEEYSRLLSNATEGGLQLGTVSFTVCPELADRADIWVLDDFSGARAHLNGFGRLNRHITISQIHKSVGGSALGQFGLAHETAHYLWGVYDEYTGFVGNSDERDALHFCAFDDGVIGCLLDGGTSVTPNNRRTEFCTDTSAAFIGTVHFRGANSAQGHAIRTDQEYYLKSSCWRQIERDGTGGLRHPLSAPTQAAPPHAPLVFDYGRFQGQLALALVLDRSGSMSAEGRLDAALTGAKAGIGLMRTGESVAVITFDDQPTLLQSMRSVDDDTKADINRALDTVTPGGGTVIGTALELAVDQLARVEGCVEPIILLSDGESALPDLDDPDVLAALQAGGHPVYAVALGTFADVGALSRVADATGGAFFYSPTGRSLPGILSSIFADAGGESVVLEDLGRELSPGASSVRSFSVHAGVESLRVSLVHSSGGDPELVLIDPSGLRIEGAAGDASRYESEVQKLISVSLPAPGEWQVQVSERRGAVLRYDLLALVADRTLEVDVEAMVEEALYPEPVRLAVGVVQRVPVGGAQVTGRVTRPDGTRATLRLHDDGLAVHGDEQAGDGVYSALFGGAIGDGVYTLAASVDGTGGHAASNLECGVYGLGEDGQSFFPVEPFAASARGTFRVGGSPSDVPSAATVELRSHAAAQTADVVAVRRAEPTPVAAFALGVSSGEPAILRNLTLPARLVSGDARALDELFLYADSDGDGRVDETSLPIAGAVLAGKELAFQTASGDLFWLDPGSEHAFLITAGQALADSDEGGSGGFEPGASAGTLGRWNVPLWGGDGASVAGPGPGKSATALLASVLAAVLIVRSRLRRAAGARGDRSARVALASLALASFVCVLGLPGCSGQGEVPLPSGSFELDVLPGQIHLQGATSGAAVSASGTPQSFAFDLR